MYSSILFGQGNTKFASSVIPFDETTTDIALDSDGNVYIAGNLTSQLSIGNNTLNYTGGYVTRYDSAGQNQWIIRAGDYGTSFPYSDSYTSPGNCYGQFGQYLRLWFLQGFKLCGRLVDCWYIHYQSTFLAKIDPYGVPLWVKNLAYNVRIRDIELDIEGNILLTGDFGGSLILDGDTLSSAGGKEILILKLSSTGNLKWMKNAGGGPNLYGNEEISIPT